jgi:hypothetical protein
LWDALGHHHNQQYGPNIILLNLQRKVWRILERVDADKVGVIPDPHGQDGITTFYYKYGCHKKIKWQNDEERIQRCNSRDFGK